MLRAIGKPLSALAPPPAVPGLYRRYLFLPQVPTQSFSGEDSLGTTFSLDPATESCDLYLNGVRLILEADYMLATNQVDLVNGAVGSPTTVEFIVLASNRPLLPLTSVKVNTAAWNIDGINTQFPIVDANDVLIYLQASTDCLVSVGGVIQEPEVDYTIVQANIIFASAPQLGSVVWMTAGLPFGGGGGSGGSAIIPIGPVPPQNPVNGMLWGTPAGTLFFWEASLYVWVQISGQSN